MAHDLLLFITWKTHGSAPLLDEGAAAHLAELLPRLAASEGATVIELAVLPDHVHAVVELAVVASQPRLAQRLKGASSRLVNRDHACAHHLKWDKGYDARSVGRRNLERVRGYLDAQSSRHGKPLLARWTGPGRVEQAQRIYGHEESA